LFSLERHSSSTAMSNRKMLGEWLRIHKSLDMEVQCGQQYEKRGRRFFEVDAQGNRVPYLKWVSFRGWVPDK
jgi:hypothetical protein